LRELLFPLRWFYQTMTAMRNWTFDYRLRRAQSVPARVISVGNLTVGGTGKTPVTLALLDVIQEHGFSAGVVSRGYKRVKRGIHPVADGPKAAYEFGDEPVLIKSAYPQVPVYVGERKVKAARKLLEQTPVDFVICDDAFQHRSLKRDMNILLLDSTEPMKNYRVLPVGRGRESLLPALRRVDYFVITKTNLADSGQVKDLIYWVKEHSEKPVLLAAYKFNGFRSTAGGEAVPALRDPAYVISGVAKPETIERVIEGQVRVVKHKILPDHHRYTSLEIETILDEASHLGARWIVTTAKDATKLRKFQHLSGRLWVIDLQIRFEGDTKAFHEEIDRLGRARD
jgi:tetraacyldisaccharide 4'-kinase